MGKLFDKHVRLFEGLVYERDAYDKRPGCDPEIIAQGLAPITAVEARGMAKLFLYLQDTPDARRWMAFYLERKMEPDPEAERQYQLMLGSR